MALIVLESVFSRAVQFPLDLFLYLTAYLLSGNNVLLLAWRKALRLDFFNEFFLMSIATIGAFVLGSYSEGVAVMVFYSIGEWFQDAAVGRAKRSIAALLDARPDVVTVLRADTTMQVHPSEVRIGETIIVKAGEKVGLDGTLSSSGAAFNTAALTGESKPDTKYEGETVLAGMINMHKVCAITVTAMYNDSKLSAILKMVEEATVRKSRTQLFISRFARVYTPVIFALAVLVCLVPALFVEGYVFREWAYRSLVFLVISCPCALVVSIPLGYFGGIGLASRNGILFKGAGFLDAISEVQAVVFDKTGTLTKGVFEVREIHAYTLDENTLLRAVCALEQHSAHPVAKAIVEYASGNGIAPFPGPADVGELPGLGLKGTIGGKEVLAGNAKLLRSHSVPYPPALDEVTETTVLVAIDGEFAGHITIADVIRDDAAAVIKALHKKALRQPYYQETNRLS
ncbi:heavy metal translocating P-type ATPase [Flavobacterium sp. J372]|nr:heavy metal translocating P-type ATPase [Flavobacterium sp. J372]MCR5862586.1 heavy metal translocating P-type ATPase [Flavobacterium sp. J372]